MSPYICEALQFVGQLVFAELQCSDNLESSSCSGFEYAGMLPWTKQQYKQQAS